jgi:hypothetical protein
MDWQNFQFRISSANRLLRSVLTVLGVLLVSFGVLIVLLPMLLQFLVGGTFILIGVTVLGVAWRRRTASSHRSDPPAGETDVVDEWR